MKGSEFSCGHNPGQYFLLLPVNYCSTVKQRGAGSFPSLSPSVGLHQPRGRAGTRDRRKPRGVRCPCRWHLCQAVSCSCPGHNRAGLRQHCPHQGEESWDGNNKMPPHWTCTLISDNTRTILQVFVSHHLLCFSKVRITWSLQNLIISAVASKNKNPLSTTH